MNNFKNPIQAIQSHLMKKWTLLILHNLLLGHHHFSDFLQLNLDLSSKVLSARLKELQRLELVDKIITSITPVQVEYHLSSKGWKIKLIVQAAILYGLDTFPEEIYTTVRHLFEKRYWTNSAASRRTKN